MRLFNIQPRETGAFFMKKLIEKIVPKVVGSYINLLSLWAPQKAFQLAYQLFSHPRKGKLKFDQVPTILQTAKRETLHSNEHAFETYLWSGNATTVLLVHGWESNTTRWEKLLAHLQRSGFTVLAIDAPAHGLSSGLEFNIPLYATFVEVVVQKYQPHFLVGHSLGGATSAFYQYYYPKHRFDKMVLLGAPSDFSIILDNFIQLLGLKASIKKQMIAYTRERFSLEIEFFSGQYFLKNSQTPGLIIHDLHDTVVHYTEAQKLINSWKNAQLITTQGLGHSLHDEHVYQQIISFLEA